VKWWEQVSETAEDNKRTVLRRGKPRKSIMKIPLGGHKPPISTAGERAKWR